MLKIETLFDDEQVAMMTEIRKRRIFTIISLRMTNDNNSGDKI